MLKKGGGVIKCSRNFLGGSSKCSCPFTRGEGGGVKKVQNLVHVVCEWPPAHFCLKKTHGSKVDKINPLCNYLSKIFRCYINTFLKNRCSGFHPFWNCFTRFFIIFRFLVGNKLFSSFLQ